MELIHEVTVGVAVLKRSLPNTTGERIAVACLSPLDVSCLLQLFRRAEEKTQVIHHSFSDVRSLRNNEPEPTCRKRLANSCPLTVALLCSLVTRNVQQLSLRPACAWLTDMAVQRSNNWRLCFLAGSLGDSARLDLGRGSGLTRALLYLMCGHSFDSVFF